VNRSAVHAPGVFLDGVPIPTELVLERAPYGPTGCAGAGLCKGLHHGLVHELSHSRAIRGRLIGLDALVRSRSVLFSGAAARLTSLTHVKTGTDVPHRRAGVSGTKDRQADRRGMFRTDHLGQAERIPDSESFRTTPRGSTHKSANYLLAIDGSSYRACGLLKQPPPTAKYRVTKSRKSGAARI
jgi:hypothetical protein